MTTNGDFGLLSPGSHRAAGLTDDAAVVSAMVRVEVAWMRALAGGGAATTDQADAVAAALHNWIPDVEALAVDAENSGNPIVPLVWALRTKVPNTEAARLIHRGLTSQDVLDTGLMLVARDVFDRILSDLAPISDSLARLADEHRDSVMAGRTLTQHAVPVTFGLKAAQWLVGVLDVMESLEWVRASLPVQVGGAAGTRSLLVDIVDDPAVAVRTLADELGLVDPGLPWHTRRTPVTRVADTLVELTDALGVIAGNVAVLSRSEIAELSESEVDGRGGSSTMPQKQNPVHSVLIRSAALQAPLLGAQVHLGSAQSLDERPDGSWHAEWPAYRRLLTLAVTATSQTRELMDGLQVHADAMRARAQAEVAALLAERHGSPGEVPADADPSDYLGSTQDFIDGVLTRHRERGHQ